jgi:hypothetical protein
MLISRKRTGRASIFIDCGTSKRAEDRSYLIACMITLDTGGISMAAEIVNPSIPGDTNGSLLHEM